MSQFYFDSSFIESYDVWNQFIPFNWFMKFIDFPMAVLLAVPVPN